MARPSGRLPDRSSLMKTSPRYTFPRCSSDIRSSFHLTHPSVTLHTPQRGYAISNTTSWKTHTHVTRDTNTHIPIQHTDYQWIISGLSLRIISVSNNIRLSCRAFTAFVHACRHFSCVAQDTAEGLRSFFHLITMEWLLVNSLKIKLCR